MKKRSKLQRIPEELDTKIKRIAKKNNMTWAEAARVVSKSIGRKRKYVEEIEF